MRILVVNQYVVPPDSGGGTRHIDLAREWSKSGHQVRLVGSNFNHFAGRPNRRLPARTGLGAGVTLRSLYSPGYDGNGLRRAVDMVFFGFAVWASVMRSARPDVVLGSSPQPFAALGAFIAAKLRRLPFVFEIRDLWPQTLVDLGGLSESSLLTRLFYALERLLISKSTAVVGIPPATQEYLLDRSIVCRRFEHIANGSARCDSREPDEQAMQRHGVARGRYFAYAGSLGSANGLEALVEAMALIGDDAVLLVMGDGPQRQKLEQLAAATAAPSRIIFTGQIAKEEALGMLNGSLANVFHLVDAPVFRYGLSPNKLIDYLAAGRPIVYAGPDVPNPASRSGAAVVARPCDPTSIASALSEVTLMPQDERDRLGGRGRDYANAQHRTDRLAAKYLQLFRDST